MAKVVFLIQMLPTFRLPNSRFFFSKSVKKLVKRGVRVLRARSAQPHTPLYGHVRREKKNRLSVLHTMSIFSVSPQSHSPFSASFQTFCLTARAYLNKQKYGLFCSLSNIRRPLQSLLKILMLYLPIFDMLFQ